MPGAATSFARNVPGVSSAESVREGEFIHVYQGDLAEREEVVRFLTLAPDIDDPDAAEAFRQAAGKWRNTNTHPNIVSVYDRGDEPQQWIAVEVVPGQPLDDVQPSLSPAETRTVISDVAEALRNAVLYNTYHLAIRPDRIWVVPGEESVTGLVDEWGLERAVRLTAGEQDVTPFTAPEVVTDPEAGDEQTDVYGLGALTYFALTGQPPITAGADLASAITDGKIRPPSEVNSSLSPAVDMIVMEALATDPADRPDSAYSFKQAFAQAFTSEEQDDQDSAAAATAGAAATEATPSDAAQTEDQPETDDSSSISRRAVVGLLGVGAAGVGGGWVAAQMGGGDDTETATESSQQLNMEGLSGYWPLDRTTNGTARDASGNDHHGQIHGDPTVINGPVGNAIEFDGKDDFVLVDMTPELQTTGSFTLELWVKPTKSTEGGKPLGLYTYDGNGQGEGTWINAKSNEIGFTVRHSSGFGQSGGGAKNDPYYHIPGGSISITTGRWHHIALKYDRQAPAIMMYVDGQEEFSLSAPEDPRVDDTSLIIGARPIEGGTVKDHFRGGVDEVLVYNRGLPDSTIREHANRGTDISQEGMAGTDAPQEDTAGMVYAPGSERIVKITPDGVVETVVRDEVVKGLTVALDGTFWTTRQPPLGEPAYIRHVNRQGGVIERFNPNDKGIRGIAIDHGGILGDQNHLYVVAHKNEQIFEFTRDGTLVNKYGTPAFEMVGISIDQQGYLWLTNQDADIVYKADISGGQKSIIDSWSVDLASLSDVPEVQTNPSLKGIEIVGSEVWVTDDDGSDIYRFNKQGELQSRIEDIGSRRALSAPASMAEQ